MVTTHTVAAPALCTALKTRLATSSGGQTVCMPSCAGGNEK